MNKIGLIVKREYMTRVRKRSFIIMTLLGPILLAALYVIPILFAMYTTSGQKKVAVVDESHWFSGRFEDSKQQVFTEVIGFPIDSIKKKVLDGYYDMALYIPAMQLNAPSKAIVYSMKQVPMETESYIKSVMKKEIEEQKLFASGVDPAVVSAVKTDINLSTIKMDDEGVEKETFSQVQYFLGIGLSMLIYFFIMSFGGQVMSGVVEEKTNRIIEVIISSVKPFQLMMGKIIGVSLVALTQFVIWILLTGVIFIAFSAFIGLSGPQAISSGTLMSQQIAGNDIMNNETVKSIIEIASSIDFGTIICSFLLFFICGYLLYATLYAAIGSLVDNNTDSQQFMLPVTVPLIIGFISSFYVVNNPDGQLSIWLSMIPLTSPISMMVRIPFGVPYWQIALSVALLIGTFVFMTWLAGRIYRIGILMYGKKLSYREVFKWIKYK